MVPVEVLEAPRPPDDPRPTDRLTPERPPSDRSDTGAEPTGDASALLDMLHAHVAELRHEAREARSTVADLTHRLGAAEGEVSAMRAILEIERERAKELREERDRWHEAATRPRRWWPFRRSA